MLFPFNPYADTYFLPEFYSLIIYFGILSAFETFLGFAIGKFLMRLKVVKWDNFNKKPNFLQNFLRQFVKLFIIFSVIVMESDKTLTGVDNVFIIFLIIIIILIFTIPDNECNLMDKISKTKVVTLKNLT